MTRTLHVTAHAALGLSCAALMIVFTAGLGGALLLASIQQVLS